MSTTRIGIGPHTVDPADHAEWCTERPVPLHPLVGSRIARCSPVGLAELVDRAALQTRVDRKYVLRISQLAALLCHIGEEVSVLEIDGLRQFRYSSTYFDSSELICFRDHRQGRRRRFKVRTRRYVDSGQCMLEVKAPDARGVTTKHRMEYPLAVADAITESAWGFVRGVLPNEPAVTDLRPTLATDYERITLLEASGAGRVTIDLGLSFRAMSPGGPGSPLNRSVAAPADTVIVETKSAHGRGIADLALRRLRIRPVSISKYCAGIALTHPQLAANRWRRTLRTHFGYV